MTSLNQYLQNLTELPEDMLLGRIVMFTIADNPVDRDDMVKWFDDLALNSKFLPPPIKAIDAFKKATTDVDETTYDRADGTKAVLLTRPVATDRLAVTRRVVREIRDEAQKTLGYNEAIEAVFYKPTSVSGKNKPNSERIRLTRLGTGIDPAEIPHIDKAIQDIKTQYETYANFLDGQKVRYVVREYLKYLNALEIKGGVYFVHKSRTAELMKLREMVSRCGAGCRMDQIPLVDTANERDIIIEAFQREAEEALMDIVQQIAHVKSTRKNITPEAYGKLKRSYDGVMNQALEYQRTLRLTQDRTSSAAEIALDALTELQKKMVGD